MNFNKLSSLPILISFLVTLSIQMVAQTTISNDITSNTVWNLAGSPYTVVSYIQIHSGIGLTIDSGVQVFFDNGVGILNDGTLIATGSQNDSVIISSNSSTPSPGSWLGFRGEGEFILSFISTSFADTFIRGKNPTIEVSNSLFTHHHTGISIDSGLWNKNIYHSIFRNCGTGFFGESMNIEFCGFENNQIGVYGTGIGVVKTSLFEGNNTGIKAIGATYLIGNTITGNDTGLFHYVNHPEVFAVPVYEEDNSVYDNQIGLSILLDTVLHSAIEYRDNQFCNNLVSNAEVSYTGLDTADYYLWNNCWCSTDSLTILSKIDLSPNVRITINGFTTDCIEDRVFPGDTDYNQTVDISDLLPIGVHYGKTGPFRPDSTTLWIGQIAPNWTDSLASGVNLKHTDTDGNGLIDDNDTLAIIANYSRTHFSVNKNDKSGGIPLYSSPFPTNLNPGDSLRIPLFLGNMDTLAQSIYGLAFSLNYDTSLVKPGSISINFDTCWMGDKGVDLLTLQKDLFERGEIDVALVKNDQQNVTGYGQIATIFVVLEDDIAKKEIDFVLEFNGEILIDKNEIEILVDGQDIHGEISTSTNGLQLLNESQIKVYPQPAKGLFNLLIEDFIVEEIAISSLDGREIFNKKDSYPTGLITIQIGNIPTGIYLLTIHTNKGIIVKKMSFRYDY